MDKIDNNKDGFISREELKDWILFTQKRYISEDVNRQWVQQNPDDNSTISWENFQKMVYGFLDHPDVQVYFFVKNNINNCVNVNGCISLMMMSKKKSTKE